jgi:hypothetical protein
MTAFAAWLKKWWKWVAGGLALLIAFITGLVVRRPKPVPVTPLPEKTDAERVAAAELARAAAAAKARLAQLEADAEAKRKAQQGAITTTTEEIKDDPQKVNDYLHKVGEEMRKP